MNDVIKAHCFIVPNALHPVSDRKELKFDTTCERIEEVYNVKLEDEDLLVQLWTLDPKDGTDGGNNFECHGVQRDRNKRFPYCGPAKLFAGKKEGDTVTFTGCYGTFEVTLRQKGYRYERFGEFHEVLADLVEKAATYAKA